MFYFSSDFHERYEPYCADFGPVNLSAVYRFCELMHERMNDPRLSHRHLVYYSDENPLVQTNMALLLASYMLLCHGWKAEQAVKPFAMIEPNPFKPFRDATYLAADFPVTLLDCLHSMKKAKTLGWFDYDSFDAEDYEYWDHPLNGDLHCLMPCCEEGGKFVAFKGPSMTRERIAPGVFTFTAKDYVEVFKDKGVSCVVRLNEGDSYNSQEFISNGIRHVDLYFDDCTVPPVEIVEAFLNLCDAETGALAVHCKAGLGRTGTLIAVWMMKHHGFTANEAIAWLRLVRPGSVIGPQQAYLRQVQVSSFVGNRVVMVGQPQVDAGLSATLAAQLAIAMDVRTMARAENEQNDDNAMNLPDENNDTNNDDSTPDEDFYDSETEEQ